MTDLLQMPANLHSLLTPLLRNLIADAPHDDAGVITMVLHQVGDVLVAPLLEELGIAILALGINPHIKTLSHDHHSQGVTKFHLQGGRHIMGCTDGIAAHLLHHLDLADKSSLVLGSSKRTKVMMQTYAFYLSGYAIELESFLLGYRDSADTSLHHLHIGHFLALVSNEAYLI